MPVVISIRLRLPAILLGGVAQRLEQRLHKPRVAGSIPAPATSRKAFAERSLPYLPSVGSAAQRPSEARKTSAQPSGVSHMPRPISVPAYRLHKQSGQAVVTLPDGTGGRRDVLLGKHGTPESRAEYARVIAEWEAGGRR